MDEEQQKLRELVKLPYLPPLVGGGKEYTLVLDLDETLIHFDCDEDNENGGEGLEEEEQGYYLIRPGCIKFLQELSKYYDLVIFTAAMPDVSKYSYHII
jgi:CTD small phosphatase-like protein 2